MGESARKERRRARAGLVTCVLALTMVVQPAQGQALFRWPGAAPDSARYTWVEQCLAAAGRVQDSLAMWGPVLKDTVEETVSEARRSPPALVIETVRRCGARFVARPDTSLSDWWSRFQLYLYMGEDDEAGALLTRRLAAVDDTAAKERAFVLDTAVTACLNRQPAAVAMADSLLVEQSRLPDSVMTLQMRLERNFNLMTEADAVADTVRERNAALRLVAISKGLTPVERRSPIYNNLGGAYVYRALNFLHKAASLDSLGHGTAGFVALLRANWAAATGESPDALKLPIGEAAPPITGEFWFNRGDANAERPTKGKISLVAFVDNHCGATKWDAFNCMVPYAMLRRLGKRFPSLEITLLDQTFGYFGFAEESPPPKEEASLLWGLAQHYRLPGAYVVESTPFWRLDAPDRRRINKATPNQLHYAFSRSWRVYQGSVFVIDEHGTVVEASRLLTRNERRLQTLIEILLHRQSATS